MADYLEDIKKLISNQFDIGEEDIEEESILEDDLGISDLDLEDFFAKIQEKYDIPAPEDMSKFKKVSDIVSYVYDNAGEIE